MQAHTEPAQPVGWKNVFARPSAKYLAEVAITVVAYFVAGKLGQATTAIRSNNLGPVWPAYGVALAVFTLYGYRVWPAVAAAAFLVAVISPIAPAAALGQAASATLAAFIGAFLLKRVAFRSSMPRLRDALWLVTLGAFGSALISSSLGMLALHMAHVAPYSGTASGWLVYWLGDSTGVLLVTPLLLTMPSLLRIRGWPQLLEFSSFMLLVVAACFMVFAGNLFIPFSLNFLAFSVLPFVMWSAIRMGTAATALSVLIIATIATVETALGSGPFARSGPLLDAVLLDIFFAVVSITGLTLAGAITERKEAERTRERFVREQAATEARLRLASIIESSDDAIIGAQIDGSITDWNKGAELLFGYAPSEIIGNSLQVLLADDRPSEVRDIFQNLENMARINRDDSSCKKKDGTRFEASVRVSPILDADGRSCGGSVLVRDVTFRKRQESALRESENRFRLVADTAPVLIWMSGPEKLCTYFNKPWLDFTGQTLESQLGNGWAKRVHGDDLERCIATYKRSFARREPFRMEYRLERFDGEYRWVLDSGVPRFNLDGSFAGYIGSCVDVTEGKQAEEAIATVNRKLIDAQEKERTRIARELHDDINQRLALLMVEIEQSGNQSDDSKTASRKDSLFRRISEISDDVQAIAHALHSSKLDHLGMLTAMRGLCSEFAEQQGVRVDFSGNDGGLHVSNEVSLTLFRILQEALHNALKHSQVRHFRVELGSTASDIFLRVRDTGVGFDPEDELNRVGLGLISMRERAKLVNGRVEIESKPMSGTTVHVYVPISATRNADVVQGQDLEEGGPDLQKEAS